MARSEPIRRVVLIGFMGAGKSSVGRALAKRLGWKFCDLDDVITSREKQSVAELFASRGEAGFRQAESLALEHVLKNPSENIVLALGGGAFVQPANRNALALAQATTVLLEAPLEELRRRCTAGGDVRPLARDAGTFSALYADRQAAYALAAHHIDTMNKSIDQVAEELERLLRPADRPEVMQ